MTAQEERALLAAVAAGLESDLRSAFARLLELIRGGLDPREAVDQVMAGFSGEMAATLTSALSAMLRSSVGEGEVMRLPVGSVQLSQRIYAEAQTTGAVVAGIVQRHVRGFQDARQLSRELFEGYGFRDSESEPLRMAIGNERLPRYLRQALLPDLGPGLTRIYARQQVDRITTPELKAAYRQALEAIEGLEQGQGSRLLEKRLRIAFYERMRYFALRIAQTELHRAYAAEEAKRLMEDDAVEFVELRRAPGRRLACICTLMVGRDLYGLGPGVYPKELAPVPPMHPFCRCVVSPRLDLTGRKATAEDDEGDAYFLRRLDAPIAARVMGSRSNRDRVLAGVPAETVANASRSAAYRIQRTGDAVRVAVMGL